ncbi:MAG: bifunctional DNA-binding transcriptional regulator/O6-methylguanine-DNA methyltransferase Ada [Anaerolineae bacterium]
MHEDTYWQAVQTRDSAFDGQFVYGVRSTGIYCRPTCPSRRPRRDNVAFFSAAAEAERQGFRACRRCNPRGDDAPNPHAALVQDICRYIDAHLDEALTLEALGGQFHLSPYHLQRTFKAVMGISPRQYAEARRLDAVKVGLREEETVSMALYEAGYGSTRGLYERSSSQLGMTPGAYRRGGQGMVIHTAIVDSPLGRLLIGATERGVCSVCLGDEDTKLTAALRAEYPAAHIEEDGLAMDEVVAAFLRYLAGQTPSLDLPVDVQATAFQWRVWQALRAIPAGETRSYSDVAEAIGQPTAARAVARACATNPVALVVPCHRVVREDGGMGGYRWGVERKRALLEQEAHALADAQP